MSKGMAALSREEATPQFGWRSLLEYRAVTLPITQDLDAK